MTTLHLIPPDHRDEPAGAFCGRVGPGARVGSFGNRLHRRSEGHGTFRGDPDRQREGSFGDHDLRRP
jgi:hypothetical protein